MADETNLLALEATAKAVDPAKYSVQSRADDTPFAPTSDVNGAGIFWITLGQQLDEEPPWNAIYPNWRDRFLRDFTRKETMIASAIYSMKTRISTLNYTLNGPPRIKTFTQKLLNNPGFGERLPVIAQKLSDDLDTSDNGAFLEKWRPGNPARDAGDSPVLGFAHLDSRQCWRSFDPEFPVWYTNPITGAVRKIHRSRIVMASDNPQPVELARNIGFCATSRALRFTRMMRNMQIFVDEKVGGRFTRAIGAVSGVSAGQVKAALNEAEQQADNKGFVIYKQIPFLIDPSTEGKNDIKILLQDLASIPDGFVFKDEIELYAYILAFCFGVDAREFWPATQSGATKADAAVQNMKARGRGIGNRIQTIEGMIRDCIPESVTFEYDYTDDEQDKMQSEIRQTKVAYLGSLVRDGAINPLEERAIAIAEGIIDGKLLESLDLPVTSDTGASQDTENDALDANTGDSADPSDGNDSATMALKSVDTYRKALRALVRARWKGVFSTVDFYFGMADVIRRYFPQAWTEGAARYGIGPDERSEAEDARLTLEINTEISYITPFAQFIADNSKEAGGLLTPLFDRIELWVNSYARIQSLAGTMAAADQKGEWFYGDTIEHCPSCMGYQGRVYRNSVWQKWLEPYDLLPKGKGLSCGGWQCDCSIQPTTKPITRGRPPIIQKMLTELAEHVHANGAKPPESLPEHDPAFA